METGSTVYPVCDLGGNLHKSLFPNMQKISIPTYIFADYIFRCVCVCVFSSKSLYRLNNNLVSTHKNVVSLGQISNSTDGKSVGFLNDTLN